MATQERLTIIPISLRAARQFVAEHHRHHLPPRGHKFSVAVADEAGEVRGVAIVGRPVARHLDDGSTLEVVRVAVDGVPNGCSKLYAATWRAARALGFTRLITYTRETEPGTSLIAAGWRLVGSSPARSWSRPKREREDKTELQGRLRWEP